MEALPAVTLPSHRCHPHLSVEVPPTHLPPTHLPQALLASLRPPQPVAATLPLPMLLLKFLLLPMTASAPLSPIVLHTASAQ